MINDDGTDVGERFGWKQDGQCVRVHITLMATTFKIVICKKDMTLQLIVATQQTNGDITIRKPR